MARYIDADKLLVDLHQNNVIRHILPTEKDLQFIGIIETIVKQPTADVEEVVRCKDCGSYNKHYGECTLNGSHYGENGYCCKGKHTPQKEEAIEDRTEEAFSLIQTMMKRGAQ